MVKGKRKQTNPPLKTSFYLLSDVLYKINTGQFLIRSDALRDAFQLFGWDESDIKAVYRKLKPKHFYKTDNSYIKAGVKIDVYKAYVLHEDIYTHFYIDKTTGKLIINSFHKI